VPGTLFEVQGITESIVKIDPERFKPGGESR
jgi:hypothetical protein